MREHEEGTERYIIVEVPAEATAEEFDEISEDVLSYVMELNSGHSYTVDLFGFVPHTNQEQVLRELFGDPVED